jgi:hypothetical protein
MRLGRHRAFAELVGRQLELFGRDRAGLLADCDTALRAYDGAPAAEAEERYGDWVDLADTVREELERMRDRYASTLDDDAADRYRDAFNRAARRRFPREAVELE